HRPGHFQDSRRFLLLRQLVVGTAAILDREVEDDEPDQKRDAAGDGHEEQVEAIDERSDARSLLGKQWEIGHCLCSSESVRSLRNSTKMKPPRRNIDVTPPARANIIALRLYLPVVGS